MSHLTAGRAQMATSLAFHLSFAVFGVGLPVMMLIAEGLHNKEIASKLGVSVKTVEFHKSRIFQRLGVSEPIAAVRLAIREGFISA